MKISVRIFDLIFAVLILIMIWPLMLIIGIIIKIESNGTSIFKQKRIGYLEKEFYIYKFRSMTIGEKNNADITLGNDKRITKFGKILRKTKLDELPQLFNIIKGEMSFVGPRPDTPEYREYYLKENKNFYKLIPGVTGKASIYLSNEEELMQKVNNPKEFYINIIIPKKVKLNEYHMKNKSIYYDSLVMIETIFKVIGIIKNKEIGE